MITRFHHSISVGYGDDDEDTGPHQVNETLKDDDDDEDQDNPYNSTRVDDDDDDDDEDSDDSEDDNLRGGHTAAYSTAMNSEL